MRQDQSCKLPKVRNGEKAGQELEVGCELTVFFTIVKIQKALLNEENRRREARNPPRVVVPTLWSHGAGDSLGGFL